MTCEIRCHLSVVGPDHTFADQLMDRLAGGTAFESRQGSVIWRLRAEGEFASLSGALGAILSEVDAANEEFSRITREFQTKQWVTIAVELPFGEEVPDGHLEVATLAKMCALGIALDIDLQMVESSKSLSSD